VNDKTSEVLIKPAKGRPMLTWVGKRPLRNVMAYPAQLIETYGCGNEKSISSPELWNDWPDAYLKGGLLFHGDNKDVLANLLANGFRGKVKLIYIDPPFDSGADYVRRVKLRGVTGTTRLNGEEYSMGEQIQYTDIWTNDNYMQFMYERLLLLKELLIEDGSIYLHTDSHRTHHLRCLMDEVFGSERFRNEIVWFYENKLATGGNTFDGFHDILLVYTKDNNWTHHDILVKVKEIKLQPVTQKIEGKRVWLRDDKGKRLYKESESERPVGDVWSIPIVNPVATERTGFPTQKPEALIERIISASSNINDLVLDCFIGSGTTAVVAQKLGRRWVGCDINKGAVQTTSKRIIDIIKEQAKVNNIVRSPNFLPQDEKQTKLPVPAQLSFSVYRVNDYDLQIQHNEAINLACEHIGITRTKTDAFFDGVLGKKLVKIAPFNHPLSPLDLEVIKSELKNRPEEERDIVVVSLGKELAVDAWLEDWNRLRRQGDFPNKIEVIELRSDPRYGGFFTHKPAQAIVKVQRTEKGIDVTIESFISPTIIERLKQQAGILAPQIDDWRAMVDSVMIDPGYNGEVFNVVLADVPEKKSELVAGKYSLLAPEGEATVAVKITDMLGEEVLITQQVKRSSS